MNKKDKKNTDLLTINGLFKSLSQSIRKVDNQIKKNIQDEERLITLAASHLIDAEGKKLRPVLTLLFSRLLKYKGKAQYNLAVCIEFIHNATLLHDDVIDGGKLRRGKKSANLIWGNKISVLVGDYLLSKAFKLMVADKSIKVLQILSETSLILARGQIQDVNNLYKIDLSEKKYLSIINSKTAELFRVSCYLPSIISNQPKNIQKSLNSFGYHFGMAFQLSDDILDYFGKSKKLGKIIGKDFYEGKVTYPIIHAYRNTSSLNKKRLKKFFLKKKRSKKDFIDTLSIMESCNTHIESIKFLNKYLKKAKSAVLKFEGSRDKVYLDALVEYLHIRDK
jgi:octaprenyl-diphosphate synthase